LEIAEVAAAFARGDLTRPISRFMRMMQGQRDLVSVAERILSELAPLVAAQYGAFFIAENPDGEARLRRLASYAFDADSNDQCVFQLREGLVGQCAFDKRKIILHDLPDDYLRISSGLGYGSARTLMVLPVIFEGEVLAVIELASFGRPSAVQESILDELTESIGIVLNIVAASMSAERQQEALRKSNDELEEKAKLLEIKNREIEFAKSELEDKAEQLAIASRYKSEFLANMSHELRTPLNSLLILAKMLADNPDRNLHAKQVEFARTIHASGADLLALINDILDLSKIESGVIAVDDGAIDLADLREYVDMNFRHIAEQKGLELFVEVARDLPRSLVTDPKRLQQILRNLLANAVKFTDEGRVVLEICRASSGWTPDHPLLSEADEVVAFSVIDTGIGIPADKHGIIFEAFQQADGTTSRKYGGTGLGLSISRELAVLLGGEICVASRPGQGSMFTLYLPCRHDGELVYPREDAAPTAPLDCGSSPPTAPVLDGRKVLVVDDDVRNIFAITSALERHAARVCFAENGREGLEVLEQNPDIDVVLMDIMMPEMDGYEVMRCIRSTDRFRNLPIIALTAKAMRDDRDKCISAGASDYVAKPVDVDQLLSTLQVWLR
jgi:signal transduction histidine kinase